MPVCVDLLLLPKNAYCAHRRRENYNCRPVTPRQPPTLEFASWHLRNTSLPIAASGKISSHTPSQALMGRRKSIALVTQLSRTSSQFGVLSGSTKTCTGGCGPITHVG